MKCKAIDPNVSEHLLTIDTFLLSHMYNMPLLAVNYINYDD